VSPIGAIVVCSLVLVGGVWLAVSGWQQPRPRLDDAMAHLRRRPDGLTSATWNPRLRRDFGDPALGNPDANVGRPLSAVARVGEAAREGGLARWTSSWDETLHLVGRTTDVHLGILVLSSLTAFLVPSLLLGLLQLSGVVSISWFVPAGISVLAAIVTPLLIHADTVARADAVRVDFRHQLGAFIDMVTMLLAGNTGYEGALDQAARAGDGLLFRQLRRRMREVSTTGRSLVEALSLVAEDYGIVELEQVAATATLSAQEGAPVARSLAAKCSTLRATLAADEEASARIRNDKVTPPLVGMALLFMALIIYPALNLN
jgi:Flp pilus assembly protein TadB